METARLAEEAFGAAIETTPGGTPTKSTKTEVSYIQYTSSDNQAFERTAEISS